MVTSAEVRSTLVQALYFDLVGPRPGDALEYVNEELEQEPSKWYLTGFLVPCHAPAEVRCDDTADEQLERLAETETNEDSSVPEQTAARRAWFPSSMGLSFLVKPTTTELEATLAWGDYFPVMPEPEPNSTDEPESDTPEKKEKKRQPSYWQRVPRLATLKIPLKLSPGPYTLAIPNETGLKLVVMCRPVGAKFFPEGTRAVSCFVVNYRPGHLQNKDADFCFQVELTLNCAEGFQAQQDPRGKLGQGLDRDEAVAGLQYRHDFEYGVGHNVSARSEVTDGVCRTIHTAWVPTAEVPRVEPAKIPNLQLGMEALASAADPLTIQGMLGSLVTEYQAWIQVQRQTPLESCFTDTARGLLDQAGWICKRIDTGLKALSDPQVFTAFRLANKVIAQARRQQLSQEQNQPPESFNPPEWRPFQMAFILLNLTGLVEPNSIDRKTVDLLFFPTGGGKTEAYLGLAAFTLILRRLTHPGITGAGLSVLMRYTLRLLTLDQLERASRLICALELERQRNPELLGTWPFEIGLWVGQSATPNRMGSVKDQNETTARARTLAYKRDSKSKPSPVPLERCPWCGTALTQNSFQLTPNEAQPKNLTIHCVNRACAFRNQNPLPILTVDEPIYRRVPCFMIATVDKFAGLPWFGQTAALFGYVTHFDPTDGFSSTAELTPRGQPLPDYLPPPDLIIQDELHLISGPLGTMVGLYETAIEALCSRPGSDDSTLKVGPKIIASTATVRRATQQIQALFGRAHVGIFPPPGPDRHNSFFAKTDFESPGRLYVGVAAQGRSLKVVLLRTYLALMAAAQKQYDQAGGDKNLQNPADPYMTLLGYFNSLRELGGSRRIVEDEVSSQLQNYGSRRRRNQAPGANSGFFARRKIDDDPQELTSRVPTNKVANTKRCLAAPFSSKERVDVALATNMISVGLDIVRLGLMAVLGQPKTASEYIQATSRVGRDVNRPGLVVTMLNMHRPRDRSHYEQFQAWHTSFYRAVEATSVTPFSPRALDRGLAGVVVALARLGNPAMTPAAGATQVKAQRPALDALLDAIAIRAETHNPNLSQTDPHLRQTVQAKIQDILDGWEKVLDRDQTLQYYKEAESGAPLLMDALDSKANHDFDRRKFKTYRSLRDVEATVNLWVRDPYGDS